MENNKNKINISRNCEDINLEKARCPKKGGKLDVCNWLAGVPLPPNSTDIVEVQFKNTRKGFFQNVNKLQLKKGDIVAVEASPGHDIGIVSLTGELVKQQMKKQKMPTAGAYSELKKIYRKAKTVDIEKWQDAISEENRMMFRTRVIADSLKLNMKIGDVEFQGDRTKAIFYYIADERVDFRELIKILAEEFRIRVEMRQIGARQEAGRIGGIGPCGRELCCSKWMTNFNTVTTNSARIQELSLNPLKLAGQCGKLKCCLNYELDCYIDAREKFPSMDIRLKTKDGEVFCRKIDIFKKLMWYSTEEHSSMNMVPVPVERVKEIIELNKKGEVVDTLVEDAKAVFVPVADYEDVVGQESLTRFDKKEKQSREKNKDKRRKDNKKKPQKQYKSAGKQIPKNAGDFKRKINTGNYNNNAFADKQNKYPRKNRRYNNPKQKNK